MRYKLAFVVMILLVMSFATVYGGSSARVGTAGGQILRIPVGSRGSAMGGAVIADVSGVESIYWNPAGLASTYGTEIMFTHLPYIADIDVNYFGLATNIENFGVLAVSAKIMLVGDMEETTWDFEDGTGRIFSPTISVISISYASQLTHKIGFGLTSKLIYEDIFEATATGVAFDIGFIYDFGWRGTTVGLTMMNYGPKMSFSGDGFNRILDGRQVSPKSTSFDIPSSFNIGVSHGFVESGKKSAVFNGNFRSNNFSEDLWQGGAEYTYDEKYSLRAGYNFSDQDGWIYGFSFGAGLVYEIGESNLVLEYSWTETEWFDNNQYFTFKFQF